MVRVLAVLLLTGSAAVAQVPSTSGSRLTKTPASAVSSLVPVPTPVAPTPAAPAAPAALTENLKNVYPAEVKLVWTQRRWQLTHRGQVLKDFGAREQEARQALRLVQQLHLDQYGTVGSPPIMEYWLANGAAPHNPGQARLDLRPVAIDGNSLEVKKEQGRWCVRDKGRVLFEFANEADAGQALAVMRKYHFDQVGVVGTSAPMHVFLGKPGDAMNAPGRQEATRFPRVAKNSDGTEKKQAPATPSPLAGVPQPGLPPLTRPTATPTPSGGPMQPTLTSRQAPLWREQASRTLGPATQPATQAERVPFDWRQAQVKQEGADWKLVAGGQVLANFGTNSHEAKLALSAVRHYRFTEEHRLGGEKPVVGYCATSLMSPRGVMLGLHAQVLVPDHLQVQQVGEGFALCSNGQVVMKLGERQEEATRLMEMIKTNRYDRLCQLGEPGKQGLALLMRSR